MRLPVCPNKSAALWAPGQFYVTDRIVSNDSHSIRHSPSELASNAAHAGRFVSDEKNINFAYIVWSKWTRKCSDSILGLGIGQVVPFKCEKFHSSSSNHMLEGSAATSNVGMGVVEAPSGLQGMSC